MAQIGRDFCDATIGFLRGTRHLIVSLGGPLASTGIELLRLPPSSPNLNAHAERFVRSIQEECLDRIIPLGERHLRRTVAEYLEHFHAERNHQGLGNAIPVPNSASANPSGAAPSCAADDSVDCCLTTIERLRNLAGCPLEHYEVRRPRLRGVRPFLPWPRRPGRTLQLQRLFAAIATRHRNQ